MELASQVPVCSLSAGLFCCFCVAATRTGEKLMAAKGDTSRVAVVPGPGPEMNSLRGADAPR